MQRLFLSAVYLVSVVFLSSYLYQDTFGSKGVYVVSLAIGIFALVTADRFSSMLSKLFWLMDYWQFGPNVGLLRYKWFVDEAKIISDLDQGITAFARVEEESAIQHELSALISRRNRLARAYNVASSMFYWSPYQAKPDKPVQRFEILV